MATHFSIAEDLHATALVLAVVVMTSWLALLVWEVLRQRSRRGLVLGTGLIAFALVTLSVLRPVRVKSRASRVGPRVVVLADRSRRLLLPADDANRTREAVLRSSLPSLMRALEGARLSVLGFGGGEPAPFASADQRPPSEKDSDLSQALESLARAPGERPEAVIVLSDGRLLRPGEKASDAELEHLAGRLSVPIHVVRLAEQALPDASLRSVHNAGVAVAHQPLALRLEIACSGGLRCEKIPVRIRELKQGEAPVLLADGVAEFGGKDVATLELGITLERAGTRIVDVDIQAPDGDRIPDNDRRLLTFNVTRERVRLLHVAGRPSYDVRSLRMWLKGNDSIDLVAFFILRTHQSDPNTTDQSEELSLIPFPVHDLFTEHLPSFDAVVLQDIDAVAYDLAQYLPALERYVRSGGGLIMVGGPSSFAGGGYARSALERVLPTELGDPAHPFDLAEFVPAYTDAGRVAPVLGPLRELVGGDLPKMVGANLLGRPKQSAIVLWERAARRAGEAPLPVLALNEAGDGRTISLAIDGTHQLAFSEFAERTAGRAYGALWDGLLGWLMRDPRYEAARIELSSDCIAGEMARLRLIRLPGAEGDVDLDVESLSADSNPRLTKRAHVPASGVAEIEVGPLATGGYTVRARVGQAPPARFDFACERGGEAFRDSRPDPELLNRIARASAGRAV
ncbi:MAG TPA: glutamine amidotransferase, partial [Polyangiaceae bacterium]|nr:glutamine amidotransferase [Polyangiaceae bacterium]